MRRHSSFACGARTRRTIHHLLPWLFGLLLPVACDAENDNGMLPPIGNPDGGGTDDGMSASYIDGDSGDDANTGGTGGTMQPNLGTPVQQCERVVDTYCTREVECLDTDLDECLAEMSIIVPCQRLRAILDPSDCLHDLNTLSCNSLASGVPGSCNIFAFEPSEAEIKCVIYAHAVCERIVECDPEWEDVSVENCTGVAAFDYLGCQFADTVPDWHDACVNALQAHSCEMLYPADTMELTFPDVCDDPPAMNDGP